MTAQVGMPIEYTQTVGLGSTVGFIASNTGTEVIFFSGGSPQWKDATGVVRDDTQMTNNSYKVVTLTGTVSVESGA